jgi:bisphosphoglycerate-independent phosphoglycerate mutase (AlkP superfamily)
VQILALLAAGHDLVVFEFYATDIAGHAQDWEAAEKWLASLDELCASALSALDPASTLALVSDHGNLEDMTHGRHTTNPVLALWIGPEAPAGAFADLTHFGRAVDEA